MFIKRLVWLEDMLRMMLEAKIHSRDTGIYDFLREIRQVPR